VANKVAYVGNLGVPRGSFRQNELNEKKPNLC
jgi:hypothetical protein